jgi:hypothetical protein
MIGSYGDEAENGHPTELSMLKLPKNVNGGILSRQGYTECTKDHPLSDYRHRLGDLVALGLGID